MNCVHVGVERNIRNAVANSLSCRSTVTKEDNKMTYDDLNKYIIHYLEHDRTHSAIMLSGPWGSGKSHYIKHNLIPALKKSNGEKDRSIVVSLYGIQDTSEISKEIYIELRSRWISREARNTEMFQTGKSVVKAIFRGLPGFLNFDIKISDEDLNNIYKTVDLSNKLIILEDIERSTIDIIELLGYVNSLVEQDNVKILIVANEDALLSYQWSEADEYGNREKIYSEDSKKYLRAKEKTISDTIQFHPNYDEALKEIIFSFRNDQLANYATQEHIDEIRKMLDDLRYKNLRTFIFACQKTVDIYKRIDNQASPKNLECIFKGIIAFSTRIKADAFPEWNGVRNLCTDIATDRWPLYRFCYDYIRWQEFVSGSVKDAFEEHKNIVLYNCNQNEKDPDIDVLLTYYRQTEKCVRDAIHRIEQRLDNEEGISFSEYGCLAVRLIQMNTILDYDYETCKMKMIRNISGKADKIDEEALFFAIGNDLTGNEKTQFDDFKKEILAALTRTNYNSIGGFTYVPSDLEEYYREIVKKRFQIAATHEFLSKFDIDRLVNMLMKCTAAEIDSFRGILWAIYRNAQRGDFLASDIHAMHSLITELEQKKGQEDFPEDRIIRYQIDMLIQNLYVHIRKIS